MTAALPIPALTALREYLAGVTHALGIGLESCTVDHDSLVSVYVALEERLPGHPGCDTALLWNEEHGWAAAIETGSGKDLVAALREDHHDIGPCCATRHATEEVSP
ncbi:DUF6292 family protein [Amycolatopsis sp., V23-08]|uniref:DUF6292 family protein n=1 Tax=Amycolatopsis heterodermiae TaxID=3110235 RepID=A0ABU5RI31_9PSEU|nr:DUF6292 family protein [Amycolatopsis sp., V23-08]MEA5365244.1 DUF6292 family protein [Amycolatopsis sp., V23-08]